MMIARDRLRTFECQNLFGARQHFLRRVPLLLNAMVEVGGCE